MSGSGAIIVMDDSTDIAEALSTSLSFMRTSCGQCTPCREGSLWMTKALHRLTHGQGRKQDADYLCTLPGTFRPDDLRGEACAWPVLSFVGKFKDEFEAKGAAEEARRVNGPGADPMPESKIAASPGVRTM